MSIKRHDAYFVDLFVRPSNKIAVNFYRMLGYDVYRTVAGYYGGSSNEDAYDMRMSLPKDPDGSLSIPTGRTIEPH